MASKLSQDLAVVATIDPQIADDATVSSDQVDMSKRDKVMFVISVGATDTTVDALVREATDDQGTDEQDLTGKAITQLAGTDDNKQAIIEVDASELSDGFTHVSLDITVGDGTTGANVSAVALVGHARYQPASDNDLASVVQIVA